MSEPLEENRVEVMKRVYIHTFVLFCKHSSPQTPKSEVKKEDITGFIFVSCLLYSVHPAPVNGMLPFKTVHKIINKQFWE